MVLIPGERLRRQRIGPHFLIFILQTSQPALEGGSIEVRPPYDGEYGRSHAILLALGVDLRRGGKTHGDGGQNAALLIFGISWCWGEERGSRLPAFSRHPV